MSKNNIAEIEEALDIDADSDADDDDIVDLLEVVKPGILSLQDGGFPDPTPVDHVVDYNESLDLPGMDDLDAFLSSLGAPPKLDNPAPSGGTLPASDPGLEALDAVPAVDAAPSESQKLTDEDFLDSLLAEEEKDVAAEFVPAPAKSDASAPSAEPELGEDFVTDPPHSAADRQTTMAEEPEFAVHDYACGMPGALANHGPAAVSAASASLTPEELALLQEGMPAAPVDQEPEFDEDAFLNAALDATMAAGADSPASASDVSFDAVRDAAYEALLKAGDVADDQTPSAPGSSEESFGAEPAAARADAEPASPLGEAPPGPLADEDADSAPALEDFLDTAAGDIASESLGMAAFDAEEKEPPEETAAQNTEATKDMEEPRGTLFPEPVLEDAPPSGSAPAAAATVPPVSASRFDEVDLNELDALLDTMLASAPAPDPAPATHPGEAVPLVAGAPAPTGESPAAGSGGVSAELASDLAALRLDVETLREALVVLPDQAARLTKIEECLPGRGESGTGEEVPADSGFADSLQRVEERIGILESRLEEAFTHDAQASLDALGERIDGLAAGLEGIERRFADFSANIDKVAAKAAATVLREEIAAMAAQDD